MLALLVLSLIAVVQSPPPRTATLTVRVVERGTNVPLGGVTISATRMASPVERLTAVTEADGTASFVDLRPGRYEVRCHSETHMAIDESLPELGGVAIALPSPPDDQDIFFASPESPRSLYARLAIFTSPSSFKLELRSSAESSRLHQFLSPLMSISTRTGGTRCSAIPSGRLGGMSRRTLTGRSSSALFSAGPTTSRSDMRTTTPGD